MEESSMKKFALDGLLNVLLFSVVSQAQGLGGILGTVTDLSGAAIASAKITVTQAGTSFSRVAISNSDGSFLISSLSPADHSVQHEGSASAQIPANRLSPQFGIVSHCVSQAACLIIGVSAAPS
jgi:hypothetical protein